MWSHKKECFYFISRGIFSLYDVFMGMLSKMIALLTLILQCVRINRNVFTLYQEEYFLYTMSLWVCYRRLKLSCKDIPGSMMSRTNKS